MNRRLALALLLGLLFAGCAPSVSPLYRDYEEVRADTVEDDLHARVRDALEDAGWQQAPAPAPNVVSTAERTLSNWGLYRIVVSLDVVPLDQGFIRVQFHPRRVYFTGGQTKLAYLDSGLRRTLLPPLNEAFEKHGLIALETARRRDEAHSEDD